MRLGTALVNGTPVPVRLSDGGLVALDVREGETIRDLIAAGTLPAAPA